MAAPTAIKDAAVLNWIIDVSLRHRWLVILGVAVLAADRLRGQHAGVGLEVMTAVQWLEPTLVASCGASGGFAADGRPAIYRRALELIESRTIEVEPLITHRYTGLDSVPRAFSGEHGTADYVKGVVLL